MKGNGFFLVNVLDMVENNLGVEIGGKWFGGRRLEWKEVGGFR